MGPPKRSSAGQKINKESTSTALVVAGNRNSIDAKKEEMLYKMESFECFHNLSYQRQCIENLLSRVYPEENGTPNSDELLRLLQALFIQAPTLQLPLPAGFIPLIRFDSEEVPYFEFHYFTPSLPLLQSFNGTDFLKTVDEQLLKYSAAIFKSMVEAHVWATHGYPVPQKNAQNSTHAQSNFGKVISYQGEASSSGIPTETVANSNGANRNTKVIEWKSKSSLRQSRRISKPVLKEFPSPIKNTRAKNGKNISNGGFVHTDNKTSRTKNALNNDTDSENDEDEVASNKYSDDETDEDSDNQSNESFDEFSDDSISVSESNTTENASTSNKLLRTRKPVNKEFPSFSGKKTSTPVGRGRKKGRENIQDFSPTRRSSRNSASRMSINCKKCNRDFSRKFTYIRHVNEIHKKVKPFICQFPKSGGKTCGYSCSQEYQAKKHVERKHDVDPNDVEQYLQLMSDSPTSDRKNGRKSNKV